MGLLNHAEIVALALSFKVSLIGVLCSLPIAVACAWLLARTRFFGKPLFEGLLLLPLILPPVVTGYVLLIVFGHHGPIGRKLGVVFQDARLFPHRSVRENLRYGMPRHASAAPFDDVVQLLGLSALLKRRPGASRSDARCYGNRTRCCWTSRWRTCTARPARWCWNTCTG